MSSAPARSRSMSRRPPAGVFRRHFSQFIIAKWSTPAPAAFARAEQNAALACGAGAKPVVAGAVTAGGEVTAIVAVDR